MNQLHDRDAITILLNIIYLKAHLLIERVVALKDLLSSRVVAPSDINL